MHTLSSLHFARLCSGSNTNHELDAWLVIWRWVCGFGTLNDCYPNCVQTGDGAVCCATLTGTRWINSTHYGFWATCFFVSIHSQAPAFCASWLAPAAGDWLYFWLCFLGLCVELGSLLLCCSCERTILSLVCLDSSAILKIVVLLCRGSIKKLWKILPLVLSITDYMQGFIFSNACRYNFDTLLEI